MALTIVVSAAPASAAVSQESYHTIQTERTHLLTKYDNHWRDADELEKEIVRLKHENSSSAEQSIDRLDQKLKNEYRTCIKSSWIFESWTKLCYSLPSETVFWTETGFVHG